MRPRLTYSNVIATLALFIALGGTGYAAASLTGRDIRDGTISTKDVKNRSLLKADFKRGQLPAGAKGDTGPQGPKGDTGAPGTPGQNGADGTAKGYARVTSAAVLTDGRNKGVVSITHPEVGAAGSGDDNAYCFDLSFTPVIAVGGPFANNAAHVATAVNNENGTAFGGCDSNHRDAVVRTYGSDGLPVPVGFDVIFE